MKHKTLYYVIVGNIGYAFESRNKREANKVYNAYVNLSKSGVGRGGNEQVTLFAQFAGHDDTLREHFPKGGGAR